MQDSNSGDQWVWGADGKRYWGKYGAAGIMLVTADNQVLLQLRAQNSHSGGTWGIPGGALRRGELPVEGAWREFTEEVDHPPFESAYLQEWVLHRDTWSYTTVLVSVAEAFAVGAADWESEALQWVQIEDVPLMNLHAGFRETWGEIAQYLLGLDAVRERPSQS